MPKRKNVFFDPKFNEWAYDAIMNTSDEQKAKLNRFELNLIRTPAVLKKFIANGNLERRLSLLTKLGIEWSLSFYKSPVKFAKTVKEAYRQYTMKGKTVEVIADMVENKSFVIHSRDVALSMSLMSVDCHSDVYVLNPGFLAYKKSMSVVKNSFTKSLSDKNSNFNHLEVSRETKNISKLVLETRLFEAFLSGVLNIQPLDVCILMLLYTTPYNYVSMDHIRDQLKGQYKPQSIGVRCSYLFRERKMIDKKPAVENVNSYIIMQEGILVVGRINNYLVNKVYAQ